MLFSLRSKAKISEEDDNWREERQQQKKKESVKGARSRVCLSGSERKRDDIATAHLCKQNNKKTSQAWNEDFQTNNNNNKPNKIQIHLKRCEINSSILKATKQKLQREINWSKTELKFKQIQ